MTTDDRAKWLADVKARADAASPAPWSAHLRGEVHRPTGWRLYPADDEEMATFWGDGGADPTFCAHARSDVPRLLAEIKRLDEALAQVEERIRRANPDSP